MEQSDIEKIKERLNKAEANRTEKKSTKELYDLIALDENKKWLQGIVIDFGALGTFKISPRLISDNLIDAIALETRKIVIKLDEDFKKI